MTEIAKNLLQVQRQISDAAIAHHRDPAHIHLLAVSKTKPVTDIRAAYAQGQRRFGENYLQEALEKIDALQDLQIEWHYIGRIQSNKTRPIAEHFAWVQGIDSIKQARRLSEQRPPGMAPLNVCLQVNVSGEYSKAGVAPSALQPLAAAIRPLAGLRLRGLMTLPATADSLAAQRRPFRQLAELQAGLQAAGFDLDTLSMGMSNDLQAAIAEGATLVRIGTAIFGARG
jgi:pyridoxal phosphate enzyme (YggS family)